ncbi:MULTISPECIES: hypothetical protein [Pseudoalteromonas]|jgi:hypothetical protein|uniref:hypothetical protein n=1 Tax=Pseudoalteromonas TaxID=53246 RepID=UPI0015723E3A|nr:MULTISPECIES: hypothetical protein [Pseudoalteromonas]MBR8845558.1 hypothetical protein [Pseudoalteromonas sp. JC3]NSY34867.1 hypothetical protein [Pseudoalteromonas sp. JC28]QUI72559.1 hypothetical protein GSF13_23865 [Pseudoalteromonas sp. M8]UDM60105.1 hypothetical protein KIJ96_09530 [Pseudoalteromonas piscicida]WJE08767.1 hypothetical protein QSH61_18220 [Pseudoalteromonas sp. JC3]
MKALFLSVILLSGQALATDNVLIELTEAPHGAEININNQSFVSLEENNTTLVKGLKLQSPVTGEVYTVTGEIIVEHLTMINANTFASDNNLILSYARGNRAIYRHADAHTDLTTLNAYLRVQAGVLSTQIGLQLDGLESE